MRPLRSAASAARTTRRRSPATFGLLALLAMATAGLGWAATRSALVAAGRVAFVIDPSRARDAGTVGIVNQQGAQVFEGMTAALLGGLAVACLLLLLGLVAWKEWAREGVLALFGLSGALLMVFSVAGLAARPVGRHAESGLAASIGLLAVAALCFSPPVRDDFERREVEHKLREREQAAARRRAPGAQPAPRRGLRR